MDKPSEEVIRAYCEAAEEKAMALTDIQSVILADALRDERAKRLEVEHKLFHWQTNSFAHCSHCLVDKQELAHRQLMGEET